MSEYGYKERPPMPDRFVPGGIVVPKNQWPNPLLKDFRDPGDAGYTRTVFQMFRSDDNNIISHGDVVSGRTNTGALVQADNGWASQYSRTGSLHDLTCNHATNTVVVRITCPAALIPRAFLDPSAPPFPGILRVEDVIAGETTTPAAGHSHGIAFGYSWENAAPPNGDANPYPWIGFQASWDNPATEGEWTAVVIDESDSTIFSAGLTVETDTPHHLALEFDGVAKQINWYVDDQVAAAYAVDATADIYPSDANIGQDIRWHFLAKGDTSVLRAIHFCDMSTVVSLTLYDLDTT